jgi:S-adenosylmethionine:tRNA ribosyltransferase-isomerase
MSMERVNDTQIYQLENYAYDLPVELIAQKPALKRDGSRLLCVKMATGDISESYFFDLPSLLEEGDLLVVNDARVTPARLYGQKETGGKVEILVLDHPAESPHNEPETRWCMVKASKRPKIGATLLFPEGLTAVVKRLGKHGMVQLRFDGKYSLNHVLKKRGCLPLPPYIKRNSNNRQSEEDRERYQTIFSHFSGAIAAPTAGLHFTHELLESLQSRGVDIVSITLLVGHDTFKPVRVKDIRDHRLGKEAYCVRHHSANSIDNAKKEGRRIIAVGTTVVRTLETIFKRKGKIAPDSGATDLLIYPGFKFQVIDALITNFHLPCSSLFFMVAAFAGLDLVTKAYHRAVESKYRFYSYGDAMLLH